MIVREDLGSAGYQAAQATHAAIDYCMKWHPQEWWDVSNRLVILTAPGEDDLFSLYQEAWRKGLKATLFCEPDRCYEATALALEPDPEGRMSLQHLSLLGKRVTPLKMDRKRKELCTLLETSHQNDKQTIMSHGESIRRASFSLMERIFGQQSKDGPRWDEVVPEALLEGPFNTWMREHLHDPKTIWYYTLFHDCGKPSCLELDAEGRRHFPHHEERSFEVWSLHGTPDEARLMRKDMDLHRLKADGFEEFMREIEPKDLATLLLTAYAEICANALDNSPEGLDSVSFKIKKKSLDRLTKKIVLSTL